MFESNAHLSVVIFIYKGLKKFYVEKYFGPPADLRHTLLSMYQKLLRNIWEFFLFEEVLSGLLLQEIKKWNRQCFLSLPSSHTKTSVFILNMFWTNLQHFYLFYFLFPKTTKEGSSWSSFWRNDGSVLPEIGFFFRSYTK